MSKIPDVPNSENEAVFFGADYQEKFDPTEYVKLYFSDFHGEKFEYFKFIVKSMHDIFKAGNIQGKTLLDIGTGPVVYSVISAAPWFDEITLSDFTPKCLEALNKWVKDDPTAFDHTVFFEYISSLQEEITSTSLSSMVRSKIKSILSCDVTQKDVLGKPALQQFDVITSSLCIQSAVTDETQFKQVVKNVAAMIKTGGHFVFSGVLMSTFYYVGTCKFYDCSLTQDMVNDALQEAGLANPKWFVFSDDKPNKTEYNGQQFFVTEAKKN